MLWTPFLRERISTNHPDFPSGGCRLAVRSSFDGSEKGHKKTHEAPLNL